MPPTTSSTIPFNIILAESIDTEGREALLMNEILHQQNLQRILIKIGNSYLVLN